MKTSSFPIILTATLIALIAFPAWGGNLPHPYDKPAINFQGRIEEGDIGYSGDSTFKFWIGDEAMTNVYWGPENAETICVEGIYNVILGRDTADLPSSIFTGQDSYYLQVAFSTDGTYFETLAPVQEILTVPFAINADLLDGLESPESAFVGVTDVQIITNKTLTDPTLTRPVIDSSYFRVTPGALPDAPAAGFFAYDNSDNKFKYWDSSKWVALEDSSATSPWTRVGTTIIPQNDGDFVQLTGASRLLFSKAAYGSAGSPLISFNPEDGGTGIYKAGPDQIDFSTQSSRRFTIRSTGAIRFIPMPQPTSGMDGDFYYDTDQGSLMYFKGATWHPIASGTGSIMNPLGADSTLRGSDGTTWVATTGFLISADGTATVQKDIRIRQKMFFYGDTNTYIQGPDQDTLEFYTGGAQMMTLTPDHRLRMTLGGTKEVPAISFGDQSHLGIYANSTYNHISFAGSQTDMFSIRGQGHVRFRPLGTAPTAGVSRTGDLHYNNTENTFMYFKGSTWHPIASGTGSIMNPLGADSTLRGSDGTTWVATTGFLISADGTATVQKDIRIRQKMFFYGDTDTYIQGPVQNILEFWTGGYRALTIDGTQRFNLRASGTALLPAFTLGSDVDTGMYRPIANTIGFATDGNLRFSIRENGQTRYQPLDAEPGAAAKGGLYFNNQSDTFMYHDGSSWKPIASGEGSIPEPDQINDTLYASDASTWSPNRELRVYPGTKVATWNDLQVGSAGGQKLYWGTAASTYITSPAAGTLDFYTGSTERMRIIATSSSAATPLISFQGDHDTGIWKPAADNIAISTGGVEAFRINASQLVGINTLAAPAARLEVKETATRPALRVEQGAADQYAVNIDQGGGRSAIRINQTASTGDSEPGSTADAGGALHIYAGTDAFGSAITAFSNQSAAAPLVWFRGGSSFNRQPILRLQANTGTAAPLHLVPMANQPAPGGTWNTYTGALYVNIDGTLYYNNGTEWLALPGESGGGDGTVIGQGASPQVAYWTQDSQISGDSGFEYDDTNRLLTADNATFTGLTASYIDAFTLAGALTGGAQTISGSAFDINGGTIDGATINSSPIGVTTAAAGAFTNLTATTAALASGATINEFSTDGTLAGNSDAAVPTEQAVKTYVDGLTDDRVGGTGTAEQIAFWTSTTAIGGDADLTFDGTVLTATSGDFTTLTGASIADSGLTPTRVVYVGDGSILTDSSNLTFDGTTLTTNQVTTGTGATIGEFSIDGTLAGNSDTALPTEQAVKTYVDTISADFAHGTGTEGLMAYWTTDTEIDSAPAFAYDNVNNRVGIGTTTPINLLHIEQDETPFAGLGDPANYHLTLRRLSSVARSDVGPGLAFVNKYDANADSVGAAIVFKQWANVGSGNLQFYTKTGVGSYNDPPQLKMSLDTAGRLGLGGDFVAHTMPYGLTLYSSAEDRDRTIGIPRTSTDAAGRALLLRAGGSQIGSTNRGGGTLTLEGGTSTGSGASKIELRTATAGAAGTADNDPSTKMTILGSGDVGITTTSPEARLHVKVEGTEDKQAFRIDQGSDQYAAYINQTGAKHALFINQQAEQSGLWIAQKASTGADAPAAATGGALHVYMADALATGSAITAYSARNNAIAPLVWFRGSTDYNNQVLLRLEPRLSASSAPPLHLVPQVSIRGDFSSLTGALYASTSGTLYYSNGTVWQALPGEYGGGDGTVIGQGASPQVAYWTQSSQISGEAGFEYDAATHLLTAVNATFTGLTASYIDAFTLAGALTGGAQTISGSAFDINGGTIDGVTINNSPIGMTTAAAGAFTNLTAATAYLASGATINEFSTDGTLAGNSDAAVPTEQAVKTYVDALPIGTGLNGAGTANTMAYWTNESTLDDLAAMTNGQLIIGSTAAAPAIATLGTSNGVTSTTGAGTLTISGISATETDIGVIEIATDAEAVTGTATDKAIVPSNLAGVFAAPPPIGVTTAAAGAFTNLTAGTVSTGLTPGQLVWTGDSGLLSGEAALAYDAANDKVTLNSGATTGNAFEITADALTSGRALKVTSSSAGATGEAMVYIERGAAGRALQVRSNNPTGSGVWVESTSITSGQTMMIKANSPALTAGGSALTIEQDHSSGLGKALFVQQDGIGEAARFTLAAGATGKSAIWVQANRSTEAALSSQTGGGAIHIQNSINTGPALTAYSTQTAPQAALAWLKVVAPFSGQPVLRLEGRTTGANPLYLVPQAAPAVTSLAGEFYVKTDGSLQYYNGTDWIALTGDSGGAGNFATRALDNLDAVAINTALLPDSDSGQNLGSAALSWGDLYVDGTAHLATADIKAGSIDNTAIGSTTASSGKFTSMTSGIVALSADGSAAAPAITWQGDADTGFYRIGSNSIGVSNAGTLWTTFDPTGHLILAGNGSNTNPIISLGGETNTGIYQASPGNIDFTLLNHRLFSMRSTGVFLLVGTGADPAVGDAGGLFFNSTEKSLKYSDGARWITLTGTGLFGSGAAGQATFWSSATSLGGDDNFFWDDTNKRLGIGTKVPDLRLDVRGTTPKSTTASEDVFRVASTGTDPLQLRLGLGTHATAASRYAYLDVDDVGTARNLVLQKNGGYLGIGTTSPRNYLDLSAANTIPLNLESLTTTAGDVTGLNFRIHSAGNLNRKGAVIFERTASYGRGSIHLATENTVGATNVSKTDARLTITSEGKVGVGTTAPDEILSVAGRAWFEQTSAPATTTDRLYNVAGDLHWAGEQLTRWASRDFTRTNDTTFTVTNNATNQAAFKVGTPVRYADTPGTWSYGMVTAYSAGTVTLAGAPMTAAYDAYLQTGSSEMLRQVNFYQQGDISAGDNFMGLATWQMAEGYVVRATGQLETAADGADVLLAIGINGASDDLITGAGQLNLGQTGNQAATAVNINPANYQIGFGERIYVNIDQIGSTTPGAGLLVTLQVITP